MNTAKVYKPQGGDQLVVAAGGSIRVLEGGINSVGLATPVNAVAATLTTALAGDNNDLAFTAKTKGAAGDDITITYVDPGAEGAIAVAVTGKAIMVTLGYAVGAITSTAAQVKAAIEASPAAAALVTVANAPDNTGAGTVTAMAATPLAGGVDGTVGLAGDMHADDTYLYVASADNTIVDANWRRIALGVAY